MNYFTNYFTILKLLRTIVNFFHMVVYFPKSYKDKVEVSELSFQKNSVEENRKTELKQPNTIKKWLENLK